MVKTNNIRTDYEIKVLEVLCTYNTVEGGTYYFLNIGVNDNENCTVLLESSHFGVVDEHEKRIQNLSETLIDGCYIRIDQNININQFENYVSTELDNLDKHLLPKAYNPDKDYTEILNI